MRNTTLGAKRSRVEIPLVTSLARRKRFALSAITPPPPVLQFKQKLQELIAQSLRLTLNSPVLT